ncbi:PucR family transcriptional regulator [Planococcus sp. ISL-110]|uniref:PucR family transcriptional regulator n=1 Tax=Planococcus sp. ISL-110 TaxID=2819167 RepID=UPI001BEAC3CB|nr:PucR family transcriptional regulator [Planococcus sp. ISL-110]MBT2571322.1 PucR family transcriptional regulator [Planococcus sp. ISL-110]
MITVKKMVDVLKDDGIQLFAGEKGIESPVDYVNVQELDREREWYKTNGFILTTFNAFKEVNRILDRLDWFKKIGVSAVGFNVVVFKEIPQPIIERANQLGLPLFYIPEEIPYHLLFERFNTLLAAETNHIKEEIQSINENMLEAVVMEKDTHHIIQMIGKFLNVPVCYLDETLEVLSYWNGSTFSKTEILEVVKNQILSNDKDLFLETSLFKSPKESSRVVIAGKSISFTIIPLSRQKDFYGFLMVGTTKDKVVFNEVIIKHGVTALIIDAIRRSAITKYQKTQDILLIESIFKNEIHTPINAQSFSFNVEQIKFIFVAETTDLSKKNEFFDFLYQLLNYWDSRSLVWLFENKVVGITFQQIPETILEKATKKHPDIIMGQSKKTAEFSVPVIRKMYNQAMISNKIGEEKSKPINYWEDLGVDKLLYVASKNFLFEDYDVDVLKPLLREDKETGGELVITLYTYLQTFFSLKESAERLYVHANTVKYRIVKIQEIYKGILFNDPDNYLLFMTAFKIYFMKSKNAAVPIEKI